MIRLHTSVYWIDPSGNLWRGYVSAIRETVRPLEVTLLGISGITVRCTDRDLIVREA